MLASNPRPNSEEKMLTSFQLHSRTMVMVMAGIVGLEISTESLEISTEGEEHGAGYTATYIAAAPAGALSRCSEP